jgi:hypothetical protein
LRPTDPAIFGALLAKALRSFRSYF